MDNYSFLRLKILEDDIEGILDKMVYDKRIPEDVRRGYRDRIREILYAGVDEITGGGCTLNFK